MAVGDAIIEVGSIAASATLDITLNVRAKITHIGLDVLDISLGQVSISKDAVNFYRIGYACGKLFGLVERSTNELATGESALFVPNGIVIRISNNDTAAHNYLFNAIEY